MLRYEPVLMIKDELTFCCIELREALAESYLIKIGRHPVHIYLKRRPIRRPMGLRDRIKITHCPFCGERF